MGDLILFFGIIELAGPGRPGNMAHIHSLKLPHAGFGLVDCNDAHSLKWHHAGFGPAFSDISTAFLVPVFGDVAARNTSAHPIGRAK